MEPTFFNIGDLVRFDPEGFDHSAAWIENGQAVFDDNSGPIKFPINYIYKVVDNRDDVFPVVETPDGGTEIFHPSYFTKVTAADAARLRKYGSFDAV